MKKKILLQDLAACVTAGCGLPKKEADAFARAFFEVIERGLLDDRFVKIKGFGSFKLVVVSERESVNVNTGERFRIAKHVKVGFTPDTALKELINRPFAHFEAVDLNDETDMEELNRVDGGLAEAGAAEEDALAAADEDAVEITAEDDADDSAQENGEVEGTADNSAVPAGEAIPVTRPEADTPQGGTESDGTETEGGNDGNGNAENPDNASTADITGYVALQTEDDKSGDTTPAPVSESESAAPVSAGTDTKSAASGVWVTDTTELGDAEAEIRVSPPTPITRSTQDREEARPQETAMETPPAAEMPTSEPTQETPHAHATESQPPRVNAVNNLNAAGGGAVSIAYTEVPAHPKHNWWKTATLTLCVLVLMALSYFAGYFQLLCPCTFFGYSVPAPTITHAEHERRPQPSRPAPAQKRNGQSAGQPANGQPANNAAAHGDSLKAGTPTTAPDAPRAGQEKPTPAKGGTDTAAEKGKPQAGGRTSGATETKPELPRFHKVKVGDNLSVLSRRYYGSDRHIDFIIKHNKLRDADNIPVGATLEFPPLPQSSR